ncbi:MAG: TIM-barrel domain-containing protein [Halorhabdus sp.]
MQLAEYHVPTFEPVADEDATILAPNARITVLSSRVLRLEYDPTETFENRPSQLVWYRDQPVPDVEVSRTEERLVVETDHLRLAYDHGAAAVFSPETLSIVLDDGTVWQYGDESDTNLEGALRTLDGVDGAAPLEDGLNSRAGWAVIEDTDRLVFGDDGWVQPRDAHEDYEDLYFFAGGDYQTRLEDFTTLTGETPLLPRWALGNWWSRYWAYSQDELRDVMEGFDERDLPVSVAVIDMDWHVVDNEYTDGWTGWTWNEEYFPDPGGFIDWLHDNDVRTALNLHPADGVHPHEALYADFAEFMGIDPASERPIAFDASDPQFLRGYFEHLIDPMEDEDGVDFWWIDWQQWEECPEVDGLDPLWALNHLHSLDRTRDGRRPFILSRWPGLGGHRYPVGFSGDAYISWESLRFQPHLTAASANVSYGWWSHDIGGHMGGEGDPEAFAELYARWTQFGMLSPINRIHTTNHPFVDKRPWEHDGETCDVLERSLRLRHELLPYLYTMAWRDHVESTPLVRPTYFHHPEAEAAYATPHQYYFGSELIAAPHLRERHEETNRSRRSVWLPAGEFFDFFTGEYYEGDRWHARYGDLEDVPLYATAGAIVPMDPEARQDCAVPERLRIVTFPGADNTFDLYEDDGTTLDHRDGAFATTRLAQSFEEDRLDFEIEPAEGDLTHLPDERAYELEFRGIADPDEVTVEAPVSADVTYREDDATLVVSLAPVTVTERITITVESEADSLVSRRDRTREHVEALLSAFRAHAVAKKNALADFETEGGVEWLGDYARPFTVAQRRALLETITGAGVDLLDHDGQERFVAWNPDDAPVTYQFSAWDWEGEPNWMDGHSERGRLPAFATFDASGSLLEGEVTLNYDDLLAVTVETEDADVPYRRRE